MKKTTNYTKLLIVLMLGLSVMMSCSKDDDLKNDEPKEIDGSSDVWQIEEMTGGVTIIGYAGTDTDVVFPTMVDGKRVIKIGGGDNVFGISRNKVTSVDMTNSTELVEIRSNAFNYCENLTTIKFPNQLEEINGFNEVGIETLDLSYMTGLKYIGYSSYSSFNNCKDLKVVKLPVNLLSLRFSFNECGKLIEVYLDKGSSDYAHNKGSFYSTPIHDGTSNAKIYYPKNLAGYPNQSAWEFMNAEWVTY